MIHLHQDIQGGAQKQIEAKILRIALRWRLLTTQPKLSKASLVITFSTLLCGRGMWVLPLMAAASLSTLTNPSQSTSQWTASSSTWTRTWPTTYSFTSLTSSFSPITPSPCQQLTWFSTLKTSGGTISPSFWRCGEMYKKGDDYDWNAKEWWGWTLCSFSGYKTRETVRGGDRVSSRPQVWFARGSQNKSTVHAFISTAKRCS